VRGFFGFAGVGRALGLMESPGRMTVCVVAMFGILWSVLDTNNGHEAPTMSKSVPPSD
jgi:hypothetical protein